MQQAVRDQDLQGAAGDLVVDGVAGLEDRHKHEETRAEEANLKRASLKVCLCLYWFV